MADDNEANWDKLVLALTIDQLAVLRENVIDMESALKMIPSAFDASFQTKINTVIEITAELEKHAIKQKYETVSMVKAEVKDCIRDEIRKNKVNAGSGVRFVFASLFSGVVSASITFGFLMFYMMD